MRIAIEGCVSPPASTLHHTSNLPRSFQGHGTLHSIYASVAQTCLIHHWPNIDLLIIGGDFQAVRNSHDLATMSVPAKYRAIGDFHEYYSGAHVAPYLTLFVGGNHEASAHLRELPYGGWVAPNIYYLGYANVVRVGGLRIAGLSGIWKGYNYKRVHDERVPFSADDVKSVYHVREWDVRQLLQVRRQVDVGVSHDWPRGVEWKGDWKWLFSRKEGFEEDARTGRLGSEAARMVMARLRPKWWFSAHLHVKFAAVVKWEGKEGGLEGQPDGTIDTGVKSVNGRGNPNEIPINGMDEAGKEPSAPVRNDDEIDLNMDDDEAPPAPANAKPVPVHTNGNGAPRPDVDAVPEDIRAQLPASFSKPPTQPEPQSLPPPAEITNRTTQFLALDKCLPNRKFLQLLELDPISTPDDETHRAPQLTYDKEWLAITRVFAREGNPTQRSSVGSAFPPDKGEAYYGPLIAAEEEWVEENLVQKGKMVIPDNFERTAEVYDPSVSIQTREQPREYTNPQTMAFCGIVGIENYFDAPEEEREERR